MDVGRMLQMAANIGRPSKAECVALLKELAEDLGPDKMQQIASLYSWFTPALPGVKQARQDVFAWCAMAVASRDARSFLEYVLVTGDYIYGSNGHRIHYAPRPDGMAEGLYDPRTREKVWDPYERCSGVVLSRHPGKCPDFQAAIKRLIGDGHIEMPYDLVDNPENADCTNVMISRLEAPAGSGRSAWLNLTYWKQAALNAKAGDTFLIHGEEPGKYAVMLRLAAFGGSVAVVMPTIPD